MKKKYIFKKQINNKGFFAGIELEATLENDLNQLGNDFIFEAFDERWKSSCKIGVELFYDYFIFDNKILKVRIINIDWMPIDTTKVIIIYSTIEALCEIFNIENDKIIFNVKDETFNFKR